MNIAMLGISFRRPSRTGLIESMVITLAVAAITTILALMGTITLSEAFVWFAGIVAGVLLMATGADVRRHGWRAVTVLFPVMIVVMGLVRLTVTLSPL